MGYLYETHLHTSQSSACGRSTGAEHVRHYHKLGYTGIFVSDHFFGGNTAAPRSGKWTDRVDTFCAGYEDAKREGDRLGVDVFFAWEESIEGDDYLIYGLDKQWLYMHPEVEGMTRRQQFDVVHAAGGCVIQAHPFRCRDYIRQIHLGLNTVDGIEIANAGNRQVDDYYAKLYAEQYGAVMTAGSDNHRSTDGSMIFGIETAQRIESPLHYASMIRSRCQPKLAVPADRWQEPKPEEKRLPLSCWLHDTSEHCTRYRQPWLEDTEE